MHHRVKGSAHVGVTSQRGVRWRNGQDRLLPHAVEDAREAFAVQCPDDRVDEAVGGPGHDIVHGGDDARAGHHGPDAGRATGGERPGDHPQHEHGGDQHCHQPQGRVEDPEAGRVDGIPDPSGEREHHDLPGDREHERRADQQQGRGGAAPLDPPLLLREPRDDAHREGGTADQPDRPEHSGHEALPPPTPRIRGEERDQADVEGDDAVHPGCPRIHGDMTRSGSGRSSAASQGWVRWARSKRLLRSIAVKPQTNGSPTSNATSDFARAYQSF